MRHLNYTHLLYFWTVAREGSIVRAAEALHLTPQTISGQLKLLEEAVGEPLLQRAGRGLVLTETGHLVNNYADEIFSLGSELTEQLRNKRPGKSVSVNVGIVDSIPKLIACRLLEPALGGDDPVQLVCWEGNLESLLGDLAVHKLDLVLSDHPIPVGLNVKAYNHNLGASDISFFVQKRQARKYAGNFPASLHDAPLLLPVRSSMLRRALDEWFERHNITPRIVAEFDDSALLKAFGEAGTGVFPAPAVIRSEVEYMYHARHIGSTSEVRETYFAISPERKLKHPTVVQITDSARHEVFG